MMMMINVLQTLRKIKAQKYVINRVDINRNKLNEKAQNKKEYNN